VAGGWTRNLAPVLTLLSAVSCSGATTGQLERTRNEATLALRQGDFSKARSLAERGAALTASQPLSAWAWTFQLLRAEGFVLQRDLKAAAPLLRDSPPDGAEFDAPRARHAYLLARVRVAEGHLREAADTLEKVTSLASERDVQFDIDALLGQVRMRLGQWSEADSTLNNVLDQATRVGDRFHQIWALNDLGMGRVTRNRFDEALPLFERVLTFTDLEQHTIYAVSLYNAGICYARLGEFDRALALQRRAVEIHQRRGAPGYFEQALGELGGTYILQGDLARALPYLQRALAVAVQGGLTQDAALWSSYLAETYAELGQWDEAERFNNEAKRLSSSVAPSSVQSTYTAGKIAAGRQQYDESVRLFTDAVVRSDNELGVRWSAYAGLANVALARRQRAEAARYFEAALDVIEKGRSDLIKTDYKLSFLGRLIQFYQQYVRALVDEGRADRALEVADSSRGRVLAERHGIAAPAEARVAAFQGLARQLRGVLLFYWLAPDRSYLWVVTPATVRCLDLPPASQIEALVRDHQTAIDNTLADPLAARDAAGDRLYRLLLEPAGPWLASVGRVVIVPDGALNRLNFETLPVGGARRHYWIEDVEVQIAPSLALAASRTAKTTATPTLLLIGDPTPRTPEFPALSYASAEMRNVSRHFASDRVKAYQRSDASPGAYRAARPAEFTMIHFTAHATANTESPLDSAIILSGLDGQFKLYARDVTEVPLRAELVTVSACRSAGERTYSGEGLIGFAWAFLRAGTKRVVAGLWDVDDRSTAELMDRFYERLAAGASPASALRDAKLAFLARGGNVAKPYYWAPFQLFSVSP
jgi:CHAT domain-containing protein/tetratricopeptide (TPR) repeat protein